MCFTAKVMQIWVDAPQFHVYGYLNCKTLLKSLVTMRLKVIFGDNFWDFVNVVIMRLFLD